MISEDTYKEPLYTVIEQSFPIELRQYDEYIVAKISVDKKKIDNDSNMFRVLASYIFGANKNNENIPMTAPVTTYEDKDSYNMIFYMLNAEDLNELPDPENSNIKLEKIILDKCAVIQFSWFTTDYRVQRLKKKLQEYLDENNLKPISPFMINRYDPPWRLPFLRRNEIIVKVSNY